MEDLPFLQTASRAYLPASFFARPSYLVAPDLLGSYLVCSFDGTGFKRGLIVEVEAYAQNDPACHGFRGKTERNAVLFGEAGHAYVYFIYGVHHCLNVVTGKSGEADGVLLRALFFEDEAAASSEKSAYRMASGPGKICQYLRIGREHSGLPYTPASGLWIEPRGEHLRFCSVQTTRIGVSRGAETPWRWYIEGHPSVSKR